MYELSLSNIRVVADTNDTVIDMLSFLCDNDSLENLLVLSDEMQREIVTGMLWNLKEGNLVDFPILPLSKKCVNEILLCLLREAA